MAAQLGLLLLLSAAPVLFLALRCGVDFRKAGAYPAVALANVLALSVSLMGQDASTLVYVALLAFTFTLSTLFASLATKADEVMHGFLSAVALTLTAVLCLMIADGNYSYGRLMGRSGPNYWGMVAIAALFGALALRSVLLKGVVVIVALAVVYMCQSRGSMLAMLAGGAVVWLILVYRADPLQRLFLVGATVVGGLGAILIFGDFVAMKLLLLDSRGRGLDSGGTGRFAAWVQAWDLFAKSPWFGVGYRQHENFITAASSAHNSYLASLADSGIVGFAAYVALMIGGAVLAIRKAFMRLDDISMAVAGLATSFLVVGLVERVGIATGNTLSLVMIYSTAWAFRSESAEPRRASSVKRVRPPLQLRPALPDSQA